jgi:hypothetical protein
VFPATASGPQSRVPFACSCCGVRFNAPLGTIHTSICAAVEVLFVKSPTSDRSSMRFSSSLWSLYSLIVLRSTSAPVSVSAEVTLSGSGRL